MNENLRKAHAEYQKKLKAGLVERLDPIGRSIKNPTSLRRAIDAKCFECNGQENWINRTKYCNIVDCPLWKVRRKAKETTAEECLAWSEPNTKEKD